MQKINREIYTKERSLYALSDAELLDVKFLKGNDDGESPLKESNDIVLKRCYFDLRYPLWHDENVEIKDCEFTINSRAPLWYSRNIRIMQSLINGVKAIRECEQIDIKNSKINSPEFMWRNIDINIKNCEIEGEYAFFESKNINIQSINFKGKYSFQYVENMEINDSNLDTKDAFWHTKNVVVKNTILKGEYLGWYSEGLTLINCTIISHQPLCYCKNLKLINCKMDNSDLAFEYSEVEATLIGSIQSIKNPLKGKIVVDEVKEIVDEQDKYQGNAEIVIREYEEDK